MEIIIRLYKNKINIKKIKFNKDDKKKQIRIIYCTLDAYYLGRNEMIWRFWRHTTSLRSDHFYMKTLKLNSIHKSIISPPHPPPSSRFTPLDLHFLLSFSSSNYSLLLLLLPSPPSYFVPLPSTSFHCYSLYTNYSLFIDDQFPPPLLHSHKYYPF